MNSKTLGEVREEIIKAGGKMLVPGTEVTVEHQPGEDIDFNLKDHGLQAWIRHTHSNDLPYSEGLLSYGEDFERETVISAVHTLFDGTTESDADEAVPAGPEANPLEARVKELEQEVGEADQRAEDAERQAERSTGNYEGMRAAFEILTLGRQVEITGSPESRDIKIGE